MEKCPDLLSDYFSFVKGIVDSQDLSLNISREMLQKDSQLKLIHNALEKKIKSELTAMKNNERDKYEEFFKNFGRQLKYGCYSDYGTHSDLLKDLLLFYSAKEKKLVSLEEYVKAMPEGQKYKMCIRDRVFAGLEEGRPSCRDLLITHNLRLVVYIARKFENSGVAIEEDVYKRQE